MKPIANQFYVIYSNLISLFQQIQTTKINFPWIDRKSCHRLNWMSLYYPHRRIFYRICRIKGWFIKYDIRQREYPVYPEGGSKVSNCKGGAIITCYLEWVLWHQEVGNTQDKKGGKHFTHEPVHSDKYCRDKVSGFVLRKVVQAVAQGLVQKDISGCKSWFILGSGGLPEW